MNMCKLLCMSACVNVCTRMYGNVQRARINVHLRMCVCVCVNESVNECACLNVFKETYTCAYVCARAVDNDSITKQIIM